MTDPIADMLTRIRNAIIAEHKELKVPYSKIKAEIARVLREEGYILNYDIAEEKSIKNIQINLKYLNDGTPVITDIKRVSKPSRRTYVDKEQIPRVVAGLGIAILSTSHGVMTGAAARQKGVGGELLCTIV